MRFLVIGIGSAGERHIKNLKALGENDILVYDKYADIFTKETGVPEMTSQMSRMERILKEYDVQYFDPFNYHEDVDAFIICTPPAYHTEYIIEGMKHYAHIFVEKPISNKLEHLDWVVQTARNKELVVQVGYQLRFHPGLKLVKEMIDEGKIGKVLSIRAEFGQYLPDWHPNEDYKNIYVGHEKDGGGIIFDASHEVNYIQYLVKSKASKIFCFSGHQSSLNIDTEDTAEISILFENGIIGNIHLDMTQRGYVRRCKVVGELGTIEINFQEYSVRVHSPKLENYLYNYNDPYLEEMKYFLGACTKIIIPFSTNLEEAIDTLKISLAAKESSRDGKMVCLP